MYRSAKRTFCANIMKSVFLDNESFACFTILLTRFCRFLIGLFPKHYCICCFLFRLLKYEPFLCFKILALSDLLPGPRQKDFKTWFYKPVSAKRKSSKMLNTLFLNTLVLHFRAEIYIFCFVFLLKGEWPVITVLWATISRNVTG